MSQQMRLVVVTCLIHSEHKNESEDVRNLACTVARQVMCDGLSAFAAFEAAKAVIKGQTAMRAQNHGL